MDEHKNTHAKAALGLLTAVNYFNYIDRYILAAVLVSIKVDLQLSDFQAGLLATAFMIPYMFTSPLFGWLGDTQNRSKILATGAAIWSIASLLTGRAGHFFVMLFARFGLGIGESAFTVISTPYISDYFSGEGQKEKRGRILSIFSTALPVGAALGYVLGGYFGEVFGWRGAFYAVGVPGLILAAFIWRLPDPREPAKPSAPRRERFLWKKNVVELFSSKTYSLAVFGYCAYTFVVGGVAYWMPAYLQRTYGVAQMKANLLFGGIAVVSGLFGTLLGGYLGDLLNKKKSRGHLRISGYSMFLALPLYLICVTSDNLTVFCVTMAFAQFFFFISTSPINVALIEVAPAHLKTSAMAMAIFAIHILGDAISAMLIGYISDQTGSLRMGLLVCTPVIFLSAALWLYGANFTDRKLLKNI
jgi:predicted MFS family arabinose efflux permease